ncbi:hypothetical protein BU24DRAFT_420025 [Aaosphaeria arxii CBS 175.79]|uniref:Uncharacterized protein n=1 Tax=Aaosphaeria arxii CBS 175.79 TaxID=1450172 RepID=A0A6A5XW94_9PLEO|nr:uncharacterized protein BU24DRAFT_420025 [Aaosphaeria arxii CBS 175.79]KAF2016981.1 hypothetical protein BU24DRAFT_420025 [Aaosphaeria arxii CBS 175.79]
MTFPFIPWHQLGSINPVTIIQTFNPLSPKTSSSQEKHSTNSNSRTSRTPNPTSSKPTSSQPHSPPSHQRNPTYPRTSTNPSP